MNKIGCKYTIADVGEFKITLTPVENVKLDEIKKQKIQECFENLPKKFFEKLS